MNYQHYPIVPGRPCGQVITNGNYAGQALAMTSNQVVTSGNRSGRAVTMSTYTGQVTNSNCAGQVVANGNCTGQAVYGNYYGQAITDQAKGSYNVTNGNQGGHGYQRVHQPSSLQEGDEDCYGDMPALIALEDIISETKPGYVMVTRTRQEHLYDLVCQTLEESQLTDPNQRTGSTNGLIHPPSNVTNKWNSLVPVIQSYNGQLMPDSMGRNVSTSFDQSFGHAENDKRLNFEFDGNTVLCRVCGDKASGFHYGVHACEGCKGFFRRSIQQKIQYRPCLKNQMCNIMRVNRNRCQYCRLRKCIAVGMSRDAVRFGRVPKREKAKIMEQMQKVNAQLQGNLLNDVLDTPGEVISHIITAHVQTCQFTRAKFRRLFETAWQSPAFVDCPAHMACPLNPSPDHCENIQRWDEFSSCFTPAIRGVVNFAKSIPGFSVFSQEDQVTLLKAGTFEVLLVHLACLFDSQTNTMMFTNGKLFRRMPSQQGSSSAGFLLDSMFDFAERLNQLRLTDEELALFSAMVIIAQDRPGLRYQEQVSRVHAIISQGLQTRMKTSHPGDPAAFSKLLMKIPDLRTLNTLHSEKLLGLTVPQSSPGPQSPPPPAVSTATSAGAPPPSGRPCDGYSSPGAATLDSLPPLPPPPLLQLPQPPQHCPISSPGFPPAAPGFPDALLRCPMSSQLTGTPPFLSERPPHPPPDKELVLQTPLGTFHRHPASYHPQGPVKLEVTTPREKDVRASPEDFIDVDMAACKRPPPPAKGLMKADMRRVMTDPMVSENVRKRILEQLDTEADPKVARLWDYDMRSSRSNSLSSSSSLESSDSAYRTISNPATPRSSGHEAARSPYASPNDRCHPLHTSTPAATTTVTAATKGEPRHMTTLRTMLTVGRGAPEDADSWTHKKLRPNSTDFDASLPPVRERAASFSTFRQKMAPPALKPVSREAPPRLAIAGSPPAGNPTFGSIVSKAMEQALLAEQEAASQQKGDNWSPPTSPPGKSRLAAPSQRHPELLSRLTGPRASSQPISRTPPPRLYPISTSAPAPDKLSPPPLLPMRPGAVSLTTSQPQRSTLSSLKDKLLKRIDSQENLTDDGPGKWPPKRTSPEPPPQMLGGMPMGLVGGFQPVPGLPPPAMLYNAAVQQYQALQQLQLQAAAAAAAHRHQMVAAASLPPTATTAATLVANGSHGANSQHSLPSNSHDAQPMNLTKQDNTAPTQPIKSEIM